MHIRLPGSKPTWPRANNSSVPVTAKTCAKQTERLWAVRATLRSRWPLGRVVSNRTFCRAASRHACIFVFALSSRSICYGLLEIVQVIGDRIALNEGRGEMNGEVFNRNGKANAKWNARVGMTRRGSYTWPSWGLLKRSAKAS